MPSGLQPTVLLHVLGLLLGIVVLAYALGRLGPARRRRIRRAVILFVLCLVSLGAAIVLGLFGSDAWASRALYLSRLLQVLILVQLATVALFDVFLPLLRIDVANIISELTVGAATIVAGIGVLRDAGVDLSGLVATSAVITAVLGLSLQATLGNVIGGVALQLDDSIHVGDWIELDGGKQGQVKEIRWRHTVVETRNWDTIVVPNATLLTSSITILGKRTDSPLRHRMSVYFNVDFRSPPAEVVRVVETALLAAPLRGVARDPPPVCVCLDFAREGKDSFAYYGVRFHLEDVALDDPTSSAVRVRIYAALKRAGIPLAVPAATIFVSSDDVEHARRKEAREHDRRLAALDSVEIFGPVTPEEKEELARRLQYAPFAAGESITREGADAHFLYIVTAGKVEIRVSTDGAEPRRVATVEAPSFFGEMGLMTGEKRTATVVAVTETECYRLGKEAFDRVMHERPAIARDISAILADRKVALAAAREHLDADARRQRLVTERGQILASIQRFFGLG